MSTPLTGPLEGSWDMEIDWKRNADPEDIEAAQEYLVKLASDFNAKRENVPKCIRVITFRKI